jgi:uncharacterized membrane protein YeaQ/YmgE (transglycosylase-associated protein family)
MSLLLWIVLGGIAGWVASMIMGTNARQGLIGDIVLGVIGGFVGGFLMNMFGESGINGFNLYSLIVAVIGAVLTVGIKRAVAG